MSSAIQKSALLQLSLDYAVLRAPGHCPLGCYIVPSLDSPLDWEGVLFIHKGLYAGLVVRFHLFFPVDYPESPPAVFIISPAPSSAPPFHPSISPTDGSISLLPPTVEEVRFGVERERNRAWVTLFRLKDLFKREGLKRVIAKGVKDQEAFRIYQTQPERFANLVAQSVALSNSPSWLYTHGLKLDPEIFLFRPLAPEEESRMNAKLMGGPAAPAIRPHRVGKRHESQPPTL